MSATGDTVDATMAPPTRVGRLSYDVAAGTWTWDDAMFRILGLEPQSVTPTADHLLASMDPAARAQVVAALQRLETDGQSFHVTFRLRAADGAERTVVLMGEPASPGSARTSSHVVGRLIDLTEDFRRESAETARQAVLESSRHRATIEQAIGTLMVAYGLTAGQAFEMLRWRSQDGNVKVRELAVRLTEAARQGTATDASLRGMFDALLSRGTFTG